MLAFDSVKELRREALAADYTNYADSIGVIRVIRGSYIFLNENAQAGIV